MTTRDQMGQLGTAQISQAKSLSSLAERMETGVGKRPHRVDANQPNVAKRIAHISTGRDSVTLLVEEGRSPDQRGNIPA